MVTLQALAAILCLVRVYALYSRSRLVLGFLTVIGFVLLINASFMMIGHRRFDQDRYLIVHGVNGCNHVTPPLQGLYGALLWTSVFIFDVAIFSLTLYKAIAIGRGIHLLDVIVRDGTMYFLVLSIMNLGNILTLRFAPVRYRAISVVGTSFHTFPMKNNSVC
ncbi:hypothetical protein BGW80DRAFT_763175 [Lactifluus volemus]|nr:hypothetical protein BGW80DRAFT_763175 [Lactifluus volemus]